MTTRRPWMPLYIGDYLTATTHLTTEEHGAYLLLLMTGWERGGALPDDDKQLAAITRLPMKRWLATRPTLAAFYQIADGCWRQGRQMDELEHVTQVSEIRQRAGKLGGKAKAKARQTDQQSTRQNATHLTPKTLSEANASGAGAPDPKVEVWSSWLPWLAQHSGQPEPKLRALVGRWCRDHGEPAVIAACAAAARSPPADPIAWITRRLQTESPAHDSQADEAGPSRSQAIVDGVRALRAARRRESLGDGAERDADPLLPAASG